MLTHVTLFREHVPNVAGLNPEAFLLRSKYNLNVRDFGPSWRDGKAFNAMVHNIDPNLVNMEELNHKQNRENLENVFNVAEKELGIPRLLDPEGELRGLR